MDGRQGRIFWLVRHPLSNIISQAKWHITGSHTKIVTEKQFNKYLTSGTFRYHLKMWRDHTTEWIGRTTQKDTLVSPAAATFHIISPDLYESLSTVSLSRVQVVRMEDFKVDCNNALGRVMDWFGLKRRSERIDCACGKDHRCASSLQLEFTFGVALSLRVRATERSALVISRTRSRRQCSRRARSRQTR